MRRFESAKEGDLVYCRLNGKGVLYFINKGNNELRVKFNAGDYVGYNIEGKPCSYHKEPVLFYRTEKGDLYLTERPIPEIDWSKVEFGQRITQSRCGGEYIFVAYNKATGDIYALLDHNSCCIKYSNYNWELLP